MRRQLTNIRQAHADERGIALAMAIMLLLLITITIAAIGIAITSTNQSNQDHLQRVVDTPAADSAIDRYEFGLRSGVINDGNDYMLEQRPTSNSHTMQLTTLAQGSDSVIPDGNPLLVPVADSSVYGVYRAGALVQPFPSDAKYTMMVPVDPSQLLLAGLTTSTAPASFWQVLRIDLPDYTSSDPNLVVYFRTWTARVNAGTASDISQAHVLRAEFRTGGFGQYQILADGPIEVGSGLNINGPVHSNGYVGDPLIAPYKGEFIFQNPLDPGTVSCGAASIFTTAQGLIDNNINGCNATKTPNTQQYVSFLAAETSFHDMWQACSDPDQPLVYCFPYTGTTHNVTVSNRQACVQWSGSGSGPGGNVCKPIWSATSLDSAMMFQDDVDVKGGQPVDARFTIGTHLPFGGSYDSGPMVPGAADIHIEGNVGVAEGAATDPLASFGLMAQGDIIIDQTPSNPCQTTEIDAAVVAETGRMAIPPEYATAEGSSGTVYPWCTQQQFTFDGSVAGHFGPITKWTAGTTWTGFKNRTYDYDTRYKTDSPPFFPLSDQWQLGDWRTANLDCFPGTGVPNNFPKSCR